MSKPRAVLAAVVAIYLLLLFVERFVLIELFVRRLGVSLLLGLAEALAILAVGVLVRSGWRSPAIDLPSDFVVGYPIFGTLCFLVGTMRIATWTMVPILAAGALAGLYLVARWIESRPVWPETTITAGGWVAIVLMAIVLACGLVVAQAPPVSLDELAYHLAVPKTWVAEGRAIDLPLLSHSYFPLGLESADLPLLTVMGTDGALASHLLHLLAAVAATILILRLARARASTSTALVVTAGIVTTPALAVTAGWSINEWPLLGISAAFLAALQGDSGRAIAAALGAGLLTKYTFLPFAAIVLVAYWWGPPRRTFPSLRVLLTGVAIGSVFFVRNLVLTGNPIAPFLTGGSPHVAGYRGTPFLAEYVFDGAFIDEALGASMIALCGWATGMVALLLVVGALAFFFLAPSARLLIPFLAVAATSSAGVIEERPRRRAIVAFVLIAAALQTVFVVYYTERSEAFGLLSGKYSDHEYVVRQRAPGASIDWLNASLPPASRTLVIGVGETFWFERPVRGGGNFDGDRISRYLEVPTPEALMARLRRDGITHVAVVSPELTTAVDKKREERQTRLTPAAQRMLAQMLDRYAKSVASRGTTALFTLR